MSLTFVHSSDWHLGSIHHGIGPRSRESGGWRLEAIRRLFDVAAEEKAVFVLVAGDVFHTETPSSALIGDVVALLRDAPVPVVIISGNHDPYAEGSVWLRAEFRDRLQGVSNVRLALDPQTPIHLDSCDTIIYPCPVTTQHTRDDITRWIPDAPRGGSAVRIGLAHGYWQGYAASDSGYNIIASDCADRCGLDYLALGDLHSYTLPTHPAAQARSFYSGAPEVTAQDDQRAGHVLVVRLTAPGAAPEVAPRAVGRVQIVDWGEVQLSPGSDIDVLRMRAGAIGNPENALLRVRLRGSVAEAARRELDAWMNEVREQLLGATIDAAGLFSEPTTADFETLRLAPAEARVLEHLQCKLAAEQLEGVEHAPRIAGWSDSEPARREARALYYQLLRESGGVAP